MKLLYANRYSPVQIIEPVAVWRKGIGQVNIRALINFHSYIVKTFAALRRDAAGTTGETPDDVSINAHKRLARQAAARFESISALIDGNYAL